jgi:hypothetical protein
VKGISNDIRHWGKNEYQLAIKPTGIAVELVVQSAAPKRGMGSATI